MKWFYMRGPGGTIACRGEHKAQAVTEAAERWECDPAEIEVTGDEAYHGSGENGFFDFAQNDRTRERIATGSALAMTDKENAAAEGKAP